MWQWLESLALLEILPVCLFAKPHYSPTLISGEREKEMLRCERKPTPNIELVIEDNDEKEKDQNSD